MAANNDGGENVRATNNGDGHGNEEVGGGGDNTGLPPLGQEYAGAEADKGGAPQGGRQARDESALRHLRNPLFEDNGGHEHLHGHREEHAPPHLGEQYTGANADADGALYAEEQARGRPALPHQHIPRFEGNAGHEEFQGNDEAHVPPYLGDQLAGAGAQAFGAGAEANENEGIYVEG